uniref:efflux RND transporter periplasmic adaptor subunit n=1 Tax=Candidatus Ventrimonas sp. TaxID=3048889 RepID=UPI003FEDAECE
MWIKKIKERSIIQKEKNEQETGIQKAPKKGRPKKKGVLVLIIGAAVLAAVFGLWLLKSRSARTSSEGVQGQRTAVVTKGTITSELSSSGVISPKDTYSLTSLVEGEVISADFEEGDQVTEGQILYQIDVSSMESELKSASTSLERAQKKYEKAQEDYNEAVSDYSGNTYKATRTGYIRELNIQAGDQVGQNTDIASIYNDQIMKIRVPFLAQEAAAIGAGNQAVLTLTDTEEQINGVVTAVSNMDEVLDGGRIVRYVTIEAANPGGLTSSHSAVAEINGMVCTAEGSFEAATDLVMKADLPSSVEVEAMLVHEGDYVTEGTPIFRIASKDAEDLLDTYQDAMAQAEESLESAQSKVDSTKESYDNYTITAPISGQVITKSVKEGDTISRNSGSSDTTLAVIYDLSQLTFEMSVDELDVRSVQVGQKVSVTADALEGQTFTGTVTNVSLESVQSNGVTNYPVTVTLDETGDLLPGMNVDGVILLDQTEDALMIPIDSLMRGNRVYVKDDTVKEAEGSVPAGFRAVEVETGLTNDDYVEIVSGLAEGEEVYVNESSKSTDAFMMGVPGGGMGGGPGSGMGAPAGRAGGPSGGPGGGMR